MLPVILPGDFSCSGLWKMCCVIIVDVIINLLQISVSLNTTIYYPKYQPSKLCSSKTLLQDYLFKFTLRGELETFLPWPPPSREFPEGVMHQSCK